MKVSSSPLYAVSYRRDGKSFANKQDLFANWTPDTLDKSLYKKDQEVDIVYTKLRNHTVGEALKETLSDIGPAAALMIPMFGAAGMLIGAFTGNPEAAWTGGKIGLGLGASVMGWAGIVTYNSVRTDVGQKDCKFSGYAYRERADQKEVKLISGWDLASKQNSDGFIIGGAAPTATGYCEIKSLGRMP